MTRTRNTPTPTEFQWLVWLAGGPLPVRSTSEVTRQSLIARGWAADLDRQPFYRITSEGRAAIARLFRGPEGRWGRWDGDPYPALASIRMFHPEPGQPERPTTPMTDRADVLDLLHRLWPGLRLAAMDVRPVEVLRGANDQPGKWAVGVPEAIYHSVIAGALVALGDWHWQDTPLVPSRGRFLIRLRQMPGA